MSYVCPNPTCRKTKCYDHCNHCGKNIYWRPPLLDKEIAYKGPKPLDYLGSIHRCMYGGVKQYKKITGDPIIDNINSSTELWDFIKKIHWSPITLRQVIYKIDKRILKKQRSVSDSPSNRYSNRIRHRYGRRNSRHTSR